MQEWMILVPPQDLVMMSARLWHYSACILVAWGWYAGSASASSIQGAM